MEELFKAVKAMAALVGVGTIIKSLLQSFTFSISEASLVFIVSCRIGNLSFQSATVLLLLESTMAILSMSAMFTRVSLELIKRDLQSIEVNSLQKNPCRELSAHRRTECSLFPKNKILKNGLATETLDGSLQLIQVILQQQHVLAVDLLLAAQLLESPTRSCPGKSEDTLMVQVFWGIRASCWLARPAGFGGGAGFRRSRSAIQS
ncbi:hypothetical protein SFRURICE_015889 [Spodoptera frugiperda]|nr:hypothetical protein SFRURICE_015889 [Spodoptera frugiperda]